MYIETVPNRHSRPAILLREGRRQGRKTVKRTLANLSDWPEDKVEALRLLLQDQKLVAADRVFAVERSRPHGHVEAVLGAMRKLGMDALLAARRCRQRDLVLAMIAQRLLEPCSKLAATRHFHATTLAEELHVEDADEDELYAALDWLLARQARIENKLAKRHLAQGARVLYDVSSSSYTGRHCPLAARGHNRDGTKQPCIVYGLLADAQGRPVAIEVYAGNTGDPATVPDQVQALRERFGLDRVVLVGDRGMLTDTQINTLKEHPGLGWISALRSPAIARLVDEGDLQLSLFDQHNLAEIRSPRYPGERLVVCYNPLLAQDRRRTRGELLEATEQALVRLRNEVARRTKTPFKAPEIALKAGKVLNRFKVGKHFALTIEDNRFEFTRRTERIEQEARLDGLYVVRTSEASHAISAEDTVRAYKSLGQVEQAFRCLKGIDLRIRPIHHRTEDHVKAHFFVCMLAYYVEWQMRQDLAPVLFQDEELENDRWNRDPVAKAQPSQSAKDKKAKKRTPEGRTVHSFQSLLKELATRCKNTCRAGGQTDAMRFTAITEPTGIQQEALALLGLKG